MKKKNKNNKKINRVVLSITEIILIIMIINLLQKESTIFIKFIKIIPFIFTITYLELEKISLNKKQSTKNVLENLSRSFLTTSLLLIYIPLFIIVINNLYGYILLSILIILTILSIIFNSINKKTIWLIFTTIIELSSILILPIILYKTNFDPLYLLLIGYILRIISIIFYYLTKKSNIKTIYYILSNLGFIIILFYILKYLY